MDQTSRLDLIRQLREQSRRFESSPRQSLGSAEAGVLQELLLGQGLGRGLLVEWLNAREGSGAATLALAVAGQILQRGGAFVVIDEAQEFYPPAAAWLGVPLDRTVIVRPSDPRSALWAWEQALRCPAVAVTFGPVNGLTERHFHRLQLAAETGGGLGFLLRSAGLRIAPSKAAVRLRVTALPGSGPPHLLDRQLRVELLHCRGGVPGTSIELELGDEANPLRLVSPLADPAPAAI